MEFKIKHIFLKVLLVFLPVLLNSCSKEDDHPVPYVRVEFSFLVHNHNLSHSGMSAQFLGHGYRGIFVYRVSPDEFRAYDRACTYSPHTCTLNISEDNAVLVGADCSESVYSLLDGYPLEGPANYPLREYRTYFDGENRLTIRN